MGPIISVKHLRTISDDRYSGHFYLFQYYIKHKNGVTKEIVTMVDKINSDAPLKISGHKIDSKELGKINGEY